MRHNVSEEGSLMMDVSQGRGYPGEPKFVSRRTVATRGVLAEVWPQAVSECLARHHHGDWGEVEAEDRSQNEKNLVQGGKIFSRWTDHLGTRFYIVTEPDRSLTTILLPEEW